MKITYFFFLLFLIPAVFGNESSEEETKTEKRNFEKTLFKAILSEDEESLLEKYDLKQLNFKKKISRSMEISEILEPFVDTEDPFLDDRTDTHYIHDATYLHLAALRNYAKFAKSLIQHGARVEAEARLSGLYSFEDVTPLHVASLFGSVEVVKLLIESGANVDAMATPGPVNPLMLAIERNSSSVAELLITSGCSVDMEVDSRMTPLHLCVVKDNLYLVNLLLDAGAPINAQSHHGIGDTALHGAADSGNVEIIRTLLERGANPNIKTADGKYPLDLSRTKEVYELLQIVREEIKEEIVGEKKQ